MASLATPAITAFAVDCGQTTIGIDPTLANGSGGAVLDGIGQTFVARDTLVTSLTVWRVALQDTSVVGIHPYLLGTDSTGTPNIFDIIASIPTKVVRYGDGINPIEFTWVFDPPIELPRPGKYAFMLFQDPCIAYFDLIAVRSTGGTAYPDGEGWGTDRSFCQLIEFMNSVPDGDLIFQIGFCEDTPTPARRTSWGQLKSRYRRERPE